MTIDDFLQKRSLPYPEKVAHAEVKITQFYRHITSLGADAHVSVGGLDSITLLCFIREIGLQIPAISVSSLEDPGNQEVHRQLGVIRIKPYMSQTRVLQELGFPVVSKAKANKIEYLLNADAEKQTFIHAIMTGDMGEPDIAKKADPYFGGKYTYNVSLLCRPGKISRITGLDEIERLPGVIKAVVAHPEGDEITPKMKGLLAQITVRILGRADDIESMKAEMLEIQRLAHVISTEGEEMTLPGLEESDFVGTIYEKP